MTNPNAAKQMRDLSDEQRREAIDAAPNVIGFARFTEKAKSVALRDGYRKPITGDGGKA